MSVILIVGIVCAVIGIVIAWEEYREAKFTKAWDKAIEENRLQASYIRTGKGQTSIKKRGRPVGSKNKKAQTKAKVSRTAKKVSRPRVQQVRKAKG